MKILLVLVFAAMVYAGSARAAFVIGDVTSPEADTCVWVLDSASEVTSPVVVDTVNGLAANQHRICGKDVVNVPVGPHNIKLKVRSSVWGAATDSPFASLDFARPGALPGQGTLRLVK